ncbi:MAG TPA: S4 domain-containing protein, partial [Chitinophagaceae bacterium]|nr:S4 domain-containing protein [Chitinophagaceae bacterium]
AIETTEKLFAQQTASVEALTVEDLERMEGIVNLQYAKSNLQSGIDVVNFLTATAIFPSKGEARKMIQNGGVSINRKKVDSLQMTVDNSTLLHKKYLLVQKGKKNYYLVKVE